MSSLKFHHLLDGPNIAKGSSSLRILGEKMSAVDFLVREAIQNSSDACYRERKDGKTFVCVDFDTGKFRSKAFSVLFNKEVKQVLDKSYPDGLYNWIAISDFNCEGLNGEVRPDDPTNRSNFCRLICDSGEAQDKEGSGGCWGYGKSVYYRIGIGIVLFYSRFKDEKGRYKSRLIIKLAEDEKSPDSILRRAGYDKSAGIAWWCKEVKEGWVYPLEDEEEIEGILKIFGIPKYELDPHREHGDAELIGTKIIIPYFDPEQVCEGLLPKLDEDNGLSEDQKKQVASLVHDIPTALKFATLRWYSSRLGNSWLKQYNRAEPVVRARIPMLKVRVQGDSVNVDDASMPDFFRAVQDLYNVALYEAAKGYWPTVKLAAPKSIVLKTTPCIEFGIRNYLTPAKAGWIVHSKFKPANSAAPNPYILTNKYSTIDGDNPPMMFFMREPGMVIDYSIGDEWLKNVGSSDKNDEFVIALFYPNVKAWLKEEVGRSFPKFVGKNLGFYLRSCEEAEHSTWTEPSGLRIVERIRVNCAAKLARVYSKTVEPTGGASGLLANYLSNRLMRAAKKSTGGSGGGGEKHSAIKVLGVDATIPGRVKVSYRLHLVKGDSRVRCSLLLALEKGAVSGRQWEADESQYDGEFPIRISSFVVSTLRNREETLDINEDLFNSLGRDLGIPYAVSRYEVAFGDSVRDADLDAEGTIEVSVDDPMYNFIFDVKSEVVQ